VIITNKLIFDPPTRLPELIQNVIRSSHGHSTPSLKISCKSIQPFSRNVADKETKKERKKQTNKQTNKSRENIRGRGKNLPFTSIQDGSSCKGRCEILHITIQSRNDFCCFRSSSIHRRFCARQHNAKRAYAIAIPSVRLSVRPSVPSLQLGTGKTAAVRLVGWLVSRVACLSVRVRQRAARPECVCTAAPCSARPPCVSTAGEARQRRVYNTKEVCYTC